MRQLLEENDAVKLEADADRRVLIVTRKHDERRRPLDEITAAYESFRPVMLKEQYKGWGLVLDVRLALGDNSTSFEQWVTTVQVELRAQFHRIVGLVATPVGMLQMQRMRRTGRTSSLVTMDPEEALRLASPLTDR